MKLSPQRRISEHFAATAKGYVNSHRHSNGADLGRLLELINADPTCVVLDVATGAGHTARTFAPYAAQVVAMDITRAMLEVARPIVSGGATHSVGLVQADAHHLPFRAASFDVVVVRLAAHHFSHPQRFVAEVEQALRPGGLFVLDDSMAPDDPTMDAFMNRFERWRDPSHVRSHTISQWLTYLQTAGLRVEHVESLVPVPYPYAEWTARASMPAAEAQRLAHWLMAAPAELRRVFRISSDGTHVRTISPIFGIVVARRLGEGS